MVNSRPLSIVEINKKALEYNINVFKSLIAKNVKLCACVKANAYGHGLVECAKIIASCDRGNRLRRPPCWLGINAVFEAEALRNAAIKNPIYILGYVPFDQIESAIKLNCRFVVYNKETVEKAGKIAKKLNKKAFLHIKIETGNNRQGILFDKALELARMISKNKNLVLEGIATHFANIEDTTDHSYANFQLKNFKNIARKIESAIKTKIPIKHCANTAATILFPETHLDMVRIGIGIYGMWPSNETYVSALTLGKKIALKPVISWKTKIAQIKIIPEGSYIGYGCTYKTTAPVRIAIIPIGYYDGYDRKLSNNAYVLIRGKRASIRGRVCMNIIMADVTDIKDAKLEDEVVLLGKQGREKITAEQMASWVNTINYEMTTRINERIPRIAI